MLSVPVTVITVLYLRVFMLYAGKLGRAVIESVYAVDSTCIGFDSFSIRGRRLLRFCVLYWLLGGSVACVFTSARRLVEFIRLVPRRAVLAGDGEFWCCSLFACICRGITVAIRRRGRGPLGLKVDMSLYWLRRMCEQVFGHLVKRRRILQAKTGDGAVVFLLLLLAGCNILALQRGARLLEQFIPA